MKKPSTVIAVLITSLLISGVLALTPRQDTTTAPSQESARVKKGKSEWVYTGKDGKLAYKKTPAGDRIMDFSHAGYMGGGVALPTVPVKRTVQPSGGPDDTKQIQAAIDEVAAMPLVNGFRGAVELAPGTFTCSGTLTIPVGGVVLRGNGSGKGGTTIKMTGDKHTAITIAARGENRPATGDTGAAGSGSAQTTITDSYVPFGVSSFTVANAAGFKTGDLIEIRKPVTAAWIEFMQMHNLVRDGKPQTWIGTNRSLIMNRRITAVTGNNVTVDIPVADSFDKKFLPSGATVSKVKAPQRITQVGVEQLHIQCPPLEIAYGRAPYSGIRINGDDCWVRDVFFEETMNTTVLAGDRITMQQVKIHHTYTNLGASKPADFSFEGSQNLLDRCESTGGNTYFVWTSSLTPGPNVVLNSTFRGHGSRIQPHQRWATAMLVDNCSVPDGGIDFLNRGVAGSGHGWTMGWGVAWNCIARTYIIQNPPGSANWAIGNIGRREQTARLFDTGPIEPEGYFDSHGTPVAPQSLYLAQLIDRLGPQALKNIGYIANTENMFTNKSVKPTPPQLQQTDPVLGENLALHRPVNTSNVKGDTREFGGEKAVDGNDKTYWTTNDGITQATLEADMENPVEISAVELAEFMPLGQRVQAYKVEAQVDSDWKLLAEGTTIGKRKVHQFEPVVAWKVKLTIQKASSSPAISKMGLYLDKLSKAMGLQTGK
ncbi:discoidin domain-containing protein [Botryobacter ruber]|uniref:discoidin domain-containing protein n=1 Tax=Botryobacter ruber TaxID=2171629 RepID=UPI000E0A32C6|nr:discoidin domain-containing protein [Botryobacter ruber]